VLMMPADISIPRLAVIALVALVTSIIGGLARRRRGRAVVHIHSGAQGIVGILNAGEREVDGHK
jgi:hypothetical protein